jgi:ClpP class serine protease
VRGVKPIVTVANSTLASAAYWIGSAADEVVSADPTALIGAIGVYTVHADTSEADAKEGVRKTLIKAGKYKGEGVVGPLDEDALGAVQEQVDDVYALFTAAVGRHMDTTASAVRDGFGQGRALMGQRAIDAGLARRSATLEQTIARLSNPRSAAHVGRSTDIARRRLALDLSA